MSALSELLEAVAFKVTVVVANNIVYDSVSVFNFARYGDQVRGNSLKLMPVNWLTPPQSLQLHWNHVPLSEQYGLSHESPYRPLRIRHATLAGCHHEMSFWMVSKTVLP